MDSQRTKWIVAPPVGTGTCSLNENPTAYKSAISPGKRGLTVRGILLESSYSHPNSRSGNSDNHNACSSGFSSRPTESTETADHGKSLTSEHDFPMDLGDGRKNHALINVENNKGDDILTQPAKDERVGMESKHNSQVEVEIGASLPMPCKQLPTPSPVGREHSALTSASPSMHSQESRFCREKPVDTSPSAPAVASGPLQSQKENDVAPSRLVFKNHPDSKRLLTQLPSSDDACSSQKGMQTQESSSSERMPSKPPSSNKGSAPVKQAMLTQQPSSNERSLSRQGMLTQKPSSNERSPSKQACLTQPPSSNEGSAPTTQAMLTQQPSSDERSPSRQAMMTQQPSSNEASNPATQAMLTQQPSSNEASNSATQAMLTQQPLSNHSSPSTQGMFTQESSDIDSGPSKGRMLTQMPSCNDNVASEGQGPSQRSHDDAGPPKSQHKGRDEEMRCFSNERPTQSSSQGCDSVLSLPRHARLPSQLTQDRSSEEQKWRMDDDDIKRDQKSMEPIRDKVSDPLQLEYWQGLASRSKTHESSFRSALTNMIIAKNQHTKQNQQHQGGLLWLPSILEVDMGPSEIAGILE
ncbi:MAG: hypothetical protein SGILL_007335 [Bacillariaceae sp.]